MNAESLNVLVLCTGNSCRSIMAEGLITHHGRGRLRAFSAGSKPTGRVHPDALAMLAEHGIVLADPRSKSWDEFAQPGAPPVHLVITVCDNAAHETCPIWPGAPVQAHWGVPDPAHATGAAAERRAVFLMVYRALERRVRALCALPLETMSAAERAAALKRIHDTAE